MSFLDEVCVFYRNCTNGGVYFVGFFNYMLTKHLAYPAEIFLNKANITLVYCRSNYSHKLMHFVSKSQEEL